VAGWRGRGVGGEWRGTGRRAGGGARPADSSGRVQRVGAGERGHSWLPPRGGGATSGYPRPYPPHGRRRSVAPPSGLVPGRHGAGRDGAGQLTLPCVGAGSLVGEAAGQDAGTGRGSQVGAVAGHSEAQGWAMVLTVAGRRTQSSLLQLSTTSASMATGRVSSNWGT